MNKSTEELKKIEAGAPDETATHVSGNGVYYKFIDSIPYACWLRGEEWIDATINHLTTPLSDIREIIYLRERVGKLEAENAELRKSQIDIEHLRNCVQAALNDSLEREAGAGHVVITVNGDALYGRISGILDATAPLPKEQE